MKRRVKIIYNPDSGRKLLQKDIPKLKTILSDEYHMMVDIEATEGKHHATEIAFRSSQEEYDIIIAAGGDGTVNEVVNGMISNTKSSLAIYPAGTINDFATHLKIPRQLRKFAEMVYNENTTKVDIGKAGDTYFLNVAAGGLLTDVAHKVSSDAKTVLGKFAYYLEGIKEFPKQLFRPIKISIQIGNIKEEKEILFFVLANSKQVGGFKKIASEAKINDGLLDLILVETSHILDAASLFFLIIKGNHINHPNITYTQVKEFTIYSDGDLTIDIDGELGGKLPMTFSIIKGAIPIIIPEKKILNNDSYESKDQKHFLLTRLDIR
ncbi:diacylglycerol/lipid kinase family protein [Alkaliphilus peptidifermentans]|uniref:Diacylglycerol kinase n=1 Tax=Alkaliphilus peptidifermentans DSM 18978 TaxID=1120976 RepID=A0A1G5CQP9_9FIRM|nr:YegS/Rv2252/BmrU family lipid kinase [Alkaliphilus peptidifermentans]SCY04598.1 diacylglycerol kinase [Alkaliphilus peptidifermentans DSM 18978]